MVATQTIAGTSSSSPTPTQQVYEFVTFSLWDKTNYYVQADIWTSCNVIVQPDDGQNPQGAGAMITFDSDLGLGLPLLASKLRDGFTNWKIEAPNGGLISSGFSIDVTACEVVVTLCRIKT